MDQVRGVVSQEAALVERFHDQWQVSLLEVPHTAVDKLGGAAGGSLAEIALFQEADGVAARRGVEGDADAGSAATDDRDIPGGLAGDQSVNRCIPIHGACSLAKKRRFQTNFNENNLRRNL
jgi:hypothetical protein